MHSDFLILEKKIRRSAEKIPEKPSELELFFSTPTISV